MDDVVEGPEETQDNLSSVESAPDAGTSATPEVEFTENFDPRQLPEELQPAWRHMHAKFTKTQQQLGEQRKQAESALALFDDLHAEDSRESALRWIRENFPEAEAADKKEEPQFQDPRVDQLIQRDQQRELEQWAQATRTRMFDRIDQLANETNVELSDREKRWIAQTAVNNGFEQEPDVETVFGEYTGIVDDRLKRYRKSKAAPSPPASPSSAVPTRSGRMSAAERLEHLNEVVNRAYDSSAS